MRKDTSLLLFNQNDVEIQTNAGFENSWAGNLDQPGKNRNGALVSAKTPFSAPETHVRARLSTEGEIKVWKWLREISSCSCLIVLPGPAWLLLNKICTPNSRSMYRDRLKGFF